ncbi:ABC transporter permease [Streptomyces sp. A7024]|uniref:ABC transporter permease n=1 Tax=Streptomyces coryli TaxID=1128680 RepID=A0A6G4U5P3_9ACTN|nr:ABC transporter permease [Streptomyces coryli]NGN66521.1 ABC transporter permease [Streptomyces coryli]
MHPNALRLPLHLAARLWLALLLIGLWELTADAGPGSYFPPPSVIVRALHRVWFSGPASDFFLTEQARSDFPVSFGHLLSGWVLAAAAGIALGLLLGRSERAHDYLQPLLQLCRSVPPPALIPFFVVVFQLDTSMYVVTIAFGAVWPVLLNTLAGVRAVDPVKLDTARVYGMGRTAQLLRIVLPGAAPQIAAGLRIALGFGLILMVLSELVGTTSGIGARLVNAQRTFDIPSMWAGIALLGLTGWLLNAAFLLVENRLLRWHREN